MFLQCWAILSLLIYRFNVYAVEKSFLFVSQLETAKWKTEYFVSKRKELEAALFTAVRDKLGGSCCQKDCEAWKYGRYNLKSFYCLTFVIWLCVCVRRGFNSFHSLGFSQPNRRLFPASYNVNFL